MALIGVDEAGKGPVLGSMFAAAVRVPDTTDLPEGIQDSKELTPRRREKLATVLRENDHIEVRVAEITPTRIDDPATDMNTLTVEAHATALDRIACDGDHIILDAGDVSEERFARRVATHCSERFDLQAEHGADGEHAVVGAASIIAKVERDAHVRQLAEGFEQDVGSGYPSDSTTRAFLANYVETNECLPECARASWQTSRAVLAANEQSGLGDF